ncbi:MAG: thiamine phosphate synthase [Sedimentisphaerales bacterium]|nr:thiamine phosphate synthase [Sedimentisphaerales bacterium]
MDNSTLRLLDANFNRAREALRVLEDYARFILDDRPLTEAAKGLRHDLCQVMAQRPDLELLGARDTPGDVGTDLSTAAERDRADSLAVVQAAAKRLAESLRTLEEYSKIDRPDLAARIEALRYRGYDLEKQVLTRADRKGRFGRVRLYVLLTEKHARRPILEVAEQVLAGGADCLQLREKDISDRRLLDRARSIGQLCREAGALFILNDRPDLAVLAGADGVHLGQGDLSVDQSRRILRPHMLIGKSVHNPAEADAAIAEDPDYLAVGSIFSSPTKPGIAPAGLELIGQVRRTYAGPLVAIGGITYANFRAVIAAGATAVAVCQSVIAAENPHRAARQIRELL